MEEYIMEKIKLEENVAKEFCENYNGGDWSALSYLMEENNKNHLLDWETECLLYTVCSMNTILNDYAWEHSLDSFNEEATPNFDVEWLNDLEDKYFDSKRKLIARFSNIGWNENTGDLEYKCAIDEEVK